MSNTQEALLWAQWATAPKRYRDHWLAQFFDGELTARGADETSACPRTVCNSANADASTGDMGPAQWKALSEFLNLHGDAQSWRLQCALSIDRLEAWLQEDAMRWILPVFDPRFPPLLRQSPDTPWILYGWGDVSVLSQRCLAIVGSRHPTPSGRQIALQWATELAESGLAVVSGLAHGIDGAAHEGALRSNGSTIAVLGSGLGHIYPKRHAQLAAKIAARGAVISECPPDALPMKHQFPARNRIIAGLSELTLVIEAASTSGTLITARLAVEANRDVWAVPGPIYSPNHVGSHRLIQQGAGLASCVEDLRNALRVPLPQLQEEGARGLAEHFEDRLVLTTTEISSCDDELANDEPSVRRLEHQVRHALSSGPVSLEVLCHETRLSEEDLRPILLELELTQHVAVASDGCYEWLMGNRAQV